MTKKLEGKIALITGGNSGVGLATAKQFVNEGAYVFITGRREPELAQAVKEIGSNVTAVQGDVANLGNLDRLFAQIKQEKGKLDIVRERRWRAVSISGGMLGHFIRTREELLWRADDVLNGIREGWLRLHISKVFPLAEAQRRLESRQSTGKIILKTAA